ncbi:Panacea domain-containing protein [Vreelandella utahensis]|uniref:Panacea domain-containing protein n=1 Tax=Vreelandella halophila TaxID=86177 RepID=UPI0009862BFE|nr:Panacea domain-containing protein [Halomonas utahensis]
MFDERKAAQVAAYLLQKRGGTMSHLKLMKLLYLCEREAMDRYERPITYDHFVSMPHGPVLSQTYEYMSGQTRSDEQQGWESWIADIQDHRVKLRKKVSRDDLGLVSDAEISVLDDVYEKFGRWNRWELRDYTHYQCQEWQDPHGSSQPIPYKRVLEALGRDERAANDIDAEIGDQQKIEELFAEL